MQHCIEMDEKKAGIYLNHQMLSQVQKLSKSCEVLSWRRGYSEYLLSEGLGLIQRLRPFLGVFDMLT